MALTKEGMDIKRYLKTIPSKADLQLDLIKYWISVQQCYAFLFPVTCDILSTPASSASVERVFLTSGEATKGKCNRLTDKMLGERPCSERTKCTLIRMHWLHHALISTWNWT